MNELLTLFSTVTCPACGHKMETNIPTSSTQLMYECSSCYSLIKPKEGECCVFCSYGTVPCSDKKNNNYIPD